eukprot:UN24825
MVVFTCVIWISGRDSTSFKKTFFSKLPNAFPLFFQAFISNFFFRNFKKYLFCD